MRLTTPSYVLQNLCLHEWTQTHCVYILSDFMNFAARLFVLEGFFFPTFPKQTAASCES